MDSETIREKLAAAMGEIRSATHLAMRIPDDDALRGVEVAYAKGAAIVQEIRREVSR